MRSSLLILTGGLFACSTPLPKVGDSTETGASADTGVDSADSADTVDSADSAPVDTSAESGDSAETATDTAGETGDTSADTSADTAVDAGPLTAETCFADLWDGAAPVDYDQFAPVLGSHCQGTNHQDITGVQRVVFVGDSITVGSPPTAADDWYRNRVADGLVDRFGLEAPGWDWENVDLLDGKTWVQESGSFASCAKYGARTDDLRQDNQQIENCIPEDTRDQTTLIVMTIGGNDIYSLLEDVQAGVDEETLRATFAEATSLLRDAAMWVTEDPSRFPNGVFLVFANLYDFTDAAGAADMALCPGAELIGMDAPLTDPVLQDILAQAQEELVSIAVDTGTDVVFLGEGFCGYGYNSADTAGRCYRGADPALYLDLTCMHPSADGHAAIADMVLSVVDE